MFRVTYDSLESKNLPLFYYNEKRRYEKGHNILCYEIYTYSGINTADNWKYCARTVCG